MSLYFPDSSECAAHTIFPGVQIRTCAADQMMLSVVEIAPHAVVEEHAHPHEQVGMVLQGRAVFVIGGEEKTLNAGDLYRIPGGVRHKVHALDEAVRARGRLQPAARGLSLTAPACPNACRRNPGRLSNPLLSWNAYPAE